MEVENKPIDQRALSLQLAQRYADLCSTCAKVHVGSLIETHKHEFMYGTNHGVCNCQKNGCRRIQLYGDASKEHRLPSDCDSIHSEVDAIARAAASGLRLEGGTIYVTRYPCEACARAIVAAGIIRVVYGRQEEISDYTKQIFETSGIKVEKVDWDWEDNNE